MDDVKKALRKRMMKVRNSLDPVARTEADALIATGVMSLPEYASAQTILSYLDFGSEVRTRDTIVQAWAAGKLVALPRCTPHTREMRWYEVDSFDGLVKSPLGVEEPDPEVTVEVGRGEFEGAICLVPGLTFDEAGFRLGYGGGFYDTLLADFPGVSVGLCREAQMSADLVAEGVIDAHDLPVNIVVTDARIIRR